MVIYELLFIIVVFWCFSILIRKDIFAPSSILCLSYIFAIICAIANINKWKINLHYNTMGVIILGLISFLITSFIYFCIRNKRKKDYKFPKIKFIEVKKYKLIILDVVSFIIAAIYLFYFVKALGGVAAFSNYSVAMEKYRYLTAFHGIKLIPTWINFLSKICRAVCYIYTYVLINNFVKNSKNKKENFKQNNKFLFMIGISIYIPLTLAGGGRYDLVVYILYAIMVFNILFIIDKNNKLKVSNILKIFLILFIILACFSSFRGLVGRTSDSSAVDYITEYFGGSIEIFDAYMQDDHIKESIFGKETFSGIHKLLKQLKIEDTINEKNSMEFVVANNVVVGNVYTGFRKMYHDFGIAGVIVLQVLLAIIFNRIYEKSFYKFDGNGISFQIIVTGTLCYCLALHSYSESFFSTVLSFNYISFFMILYLIIYFLENVEVKIK